MPTENQSMPLPELPGPVPQTAATSSDVAQTSADFRTVPKDAEEFGKVPQVAERKENHTLTVRETARMFETAGVARTERSIINWCQPNRQGIARLDSYYEPNERKYFITPQSVETAIQEEIQRAKKSTDVPDSESFGSHVEPVKHSSATATAKAADERKVQELEREIMDLKITNRGKDMFIEQLKSERAGFFEQLMSANRTVGQLETKLHQLDGPKL
ncbi:MAG TPA: hypothetical protein VIK28_10425 [Sedimentisphaerales bacterium]